MHVNEEIYPNNGTAAFRGGGLFLINEKETEETDGIYTLARPYRVQSSGRIQ